MYFLKIHHIVHVKGKVNSASHYWKVVCPSLNYIIYNHSLPGRQIILVTSQMLYCFGNFVCEIENKPTV